MRTGQLFWSGRRVLVTGHTGFKGTWLCHWLAELGADPPNLTPDGVRTLKNNPGRVAEVNKEVEQIGAKVLSQYATLGQYDFVTILEAPDEQTMAKVSVELGSRGTMTSQTLAAMPADELAGSL